MEYLKSKNVERIWIEAAFIAVIMLEKVMAKLKEENNQKFFKTRKLKWMQKLILKVEKNSFIALNLIYS